MPGWVGDVGTAPSEISLIRGVWKGGVAMKFIQDLVELTNAIRLLIGPVKTLIVDIVIAAVTLYELYRWATSFWN